ncbi:MAG: hypothetical protein LBI42_02630 [Chitinispirillales bacterium]|jgi:anti-anti-sigma regulatory factor|nr:hypothetical protein [Chitinispirillales bacterium]
MSFWRFEHEKFLFIKYNQETVSDLENLKKELTAESLRSSCRDIVLDCSKAGFISSVEIGIIIQFLKTLPGTGRFLRLVASSYVCELLIAMNIHRISNIIIYNSLEMVQQHFGPSVDISALKPA